MKKKFSLYFLLLIAHFSFCQTLDKKWNSMVEKSNSYNSHKIIKGEELQEMWSSVQDSLLQMRINLKTEQNKINVLTGEIGNLNSKISASNEEYTIIAGERDSAIEKSNSNTTYIMSLWIGLVLVSILCGILFVLFNKSNSLTKSKTNDYEQLTKSFEDYKTTKLELERKLKREIQTYMNKFEEMKIKF